MITQAKALARISVEFGLHPSLWRWAWLNRQAISNNDRWHSAETDKWLYRGASYCISCRNPIMEGFMCDSCTHDQGLLVAEPNMGAIQQGQVKWNKAVENEGAD